MRSIGGGVCFSFFSLVSLIFFTGCGNTPQPYVPTGPTAAEIEAQRAADEAARQRAQEVADAMAFKAAISAYKKGDYHTALAGFSQLANRGHAMATSNLAVMVLHGEGRASDPQEAFRLFSKAANYGVPHAIANAGIMQVVGLGTNFDPESGAVFVRKALASTELENSVRSNVTERVQAICSDATQELRNLPSNFDLAMKYMPIKTIACGALSIPDSKDGEEAGNKFIACVMAGCLAEEVSEKSSCRILSEESEKSDVRRKRLTRTIRALGCSA